MGDKVASWYIPGEGNQPAGPFTAEQLFQSWRAGKLSDTTKCWREGMTQWLPLAQVEPFALAIRRARTSRDTTAHSRMAIPPQATSHPVGPMPLSIFPATLHRMMQRAESVFAIRVMLAGAALCAVAGAISIAALSYSWPKEYYYDTVHGRHVLCDYPYNPYVHGDKTGHPWHEQDRAYDLGAHLYIDPYYTFRVRLFLHSFSGWAFLVAFPVFITSLGILFNGITRVLREIVWGRSRMRQE